MSKLRFVIAVAVIAGCAFLGSLVGSTYLQARSAEAAAVKRSPLSVTVAALARRVRVLETRVGDGPTGLARRVRAVEAQVGIGTTPGALPCQIDLIWSYLDRLRAALVANAELPLTHDELCL
jgi:hypothetical protein